jgi:hypothetical protein
MTLPMQALSSGRETMPLISTLHPTVSGAGEQGACSEWLSMQFSFKPALCGGKSSFEEERRDNGGRGRGGGARPAVECMMSYPDEGETLRPL